MTSKGTDKEKAVLSRLQRQCARMECCPSDIRRKALKALDSDAEAAGRVVDSLISEGYLSEKRYASAFAREKASIQGWGPLKITFQLRGKGISDEAIKEALSEVDSSSSEAKLRNLAVSKYRLLSGDPQSRLKLLKYLLSRGYSYDEIAPVVEEVTGKGEAEL